MSDRDTLINRVQEIIQDTLEKATFERVGREFMKEGHQPLSDQEILALAERLVDDLDIQLKR